VVLSADKRTHALRQEAQDLERVCGEATSEAAVRSASARLCEIYEELNAAGAEAESLQRTRAMALLKGLGFSEASCGAPIVSLSGGWRMRVALATALFLKPRLLMLDEPTNHLDLGAIEWLQRHLVSEYQGTVLCVSHDRAFINEVCTEVIIFADQSLTYFNGTLDAFEEAAAERARHLERQAAALESKRGHMLESIRSAEQKCAREDKNRAKNSEARRYAALQGAREGRRRCAMVATRQEKLARAGMEKTEDGKRFRACEHGNRTGSAAENEGGWEHGMMTASPLLQRKDLALKFGFASGEGLRLAEGMPLLQLKDVAYAYPGTGGPALVDVELSVSAGCRIAIQGRNAAGKSTLVKLMTGELEPTSGEVWRHHNLKVSVVSQHDADVLARLPASPLAYMQGCLPGSKEQDLRRQLGAFGVVGDMVHQALHTLSGGQRVRVVFAKVCMEKPHLLVLDEPTNHLDIYSIDALADSLKEFEGGVILVTHNRSLLQEVAKELFVVHSRTRRLALVSRALPDGPPLEIPSVQDMSPHPSSGLSEAENDGLPLLLGNQQLRSSKAAEPARRGAEKPVATPSKPTEAAARPKPTLPPWLRR